jgi:hypothetical protein
VQQWGAELRAHIVFTVDIPEGSRRIQLSTTYDVNSPIDRFPGRNATTKPSLWWGESLLAWYNIKLTSDMSIATQAARTAKDPTKFYKGYGEFLPPKDPIRHVSDIQSPNFFRTPIPDCFFINRSDDGLEDRIKFCWINKDEKTQEVKQETPLEGIWPTAATITKVFHSTILLDLGQDNPNILTDKKLLQVFSEPITNMLAQQAGNQTERNRKWGFGNNIIISREHPGLAQGPYTPQNATNWALSFQPSCIAVSYLCQIPRMKSTSSLVFSVFIADFVLLQVLWEVFVLIVDFFMYRRHADMGSCQGCQPTRAFSEVGLEMLRPASTVSSLVLTPKPRAAYSPLETS